MARNIGEALPYIIFSGNVIAMEYNNCSNEYCLHIRTYHLEFYLYTSSDAEIKPGYVIYGKAYLYADVVNTDGEGSHLA